MDVDIEEVHRLLDQIEMTRSLLKEEHREAIRPEEAGELVLVLGDIIGWGSAYSSDLPKILGLPKGPLNDLIKLRNEVYTKDCLLIAERLRSHLKSLDKISTPQTNRTRSPKQVNGLAFSAQEWRSMLKTSDNKQKIEAVSRLLEDLILKVEHNNAPTRQQALTVSERAQLISILETVLALLKGNMVEKGILLKAREFIGRLAVSAAEKEMQMGVETVANNSTFALTELIHSIFR